MSDTTVAPPPPPPPTGQPQYVYVQPPNYAQRARTNGMAIASLVCSIVCLWGVGSILGIIFGVIARRQIDESNGQEGGRGMATAGLVVGIVGLIGTILWFLLVIGLAASTPTYS